MKKLSFILSLLLVATAFAAKAPKKDFSDFEASLTGPSVDSATESDSAKGSLSDFESSLANRSSESENIYKT